MSQMKRITPETLTALPVIVRVVETQSFSEAARQLGMTPSGVSKAISRLEERLEVRLFHRTTRKVSPTEEGLRFYERGRQIVSDIEEAQTELIEARVEPRGTIMATVPRELGRFVVRALPDFLQRYPEIEVKLELTDRKVDLIGERIDVALRVGGGSTNSRGRLKSRVIAQTHAIVCASPDYIQRYPHPKHPKDLAKHNVYTFGSHRGESTQNWPFYKKGQEQHELISVQGNATVDSGDALIDLALQGHGLIAVFDFLAAPAIKNGELIQLLPEWQVFKSLPIHLIYPKHRRLSVKAMTFVDYVEEVISNAL